MFRSNRISNKLTISLILVSVMVLGIIGTVSATEFPKGDSIPAGETIEDDVFISGENVTIDGNVEGILIAAGSTVTLNGTVTGDAFLAAETVVVGQDAVVDGNLFIAGADLTVEGEITGSLFGGSSALELTESASVGSNFYAGAFSIIAAEGSSVGRDQLGGAYQAILSGEIGRDLKIGAAAVELNGSVGRDASIEVGDVESSQESTYWMRFNPYFGQYVPEVVEPGIRVSDDATIGGDLVYTSSKEQSDELDAITAGNVVYQTPMPYETQQMQRPQAGQQKEMDEGFPAGFLAGAVFLATVRKFIRLFVLGALALWLLSKPFKKLVDAAYAEPLKAMGWGFVLAAIGFLAVFIVPIIFVLLGILIGFLSLTSLLYFWFGIIGVALLLAFMVFFYILFSVSKLLAAFMFGRWLMKVIFKQEEKPWLSLLIGVLLYVLIRAIPIIGWLAGLAALLIGSGAFWLVMFSKKPEKKKK